MDFGKVMDRIRIILERKSDNKIFDKDIATVLDMTSTQYSNAKTRNSIPYERIAIFCAKRRINMNWVLFEQNIKMLTDEFEDAYRIKLLNNVNASAGGGAFNEEIEDYTYLTIDPIFKDMLGITKHDQVEAIRVTGNSMEDTLAEGSIILIHREKTELVDGGIFVVNTPGGVFVKRIGFNPSGGIDLKSDNRDFETVTLTGAEIMVIGKVIGALEKI